MKISSPAARGRLLKRGLVAGLLTSALVLTGCATDTTPTENVEQTLTIASTRADFTSLDSGAITSGGYEEQRLLGNTIYEGLTKKDVSDPDTIAPGDAPALATSWKTDEDGLGYTFTLREGVLFHDGTDWNADAALFNLDRYMNTESAYYDATVSATYSVLNRVASVEKIDDYTIHLRLKAIYAYFISDLYPLYFASPTSLEKDGSAGQAINPVGTGAFKFESQNGNEEIVLAKNEDYWGDVPLLDNLVIVNIPDPAARIAALRSGRVDWIEGVSPDDIPSLEAASYVITEKQFDWVWQWTFVANKAPFDNADVRLAMNYAIDREAIATSLLAGTAEPISQMLPAVNPLYDADDDLYEYDVDKAKELLADGGYPDGFDMVLSYPASGSGYMLPRAMNEALQAQLAKVGINVTLLVEDNPTFNAKSASPEGADSNARMAAGTMDLYSSWNGYLFGCGVSRYKYCNEEISAILTEADLTVDDEKRGELLQEAAGLLTVDAPRMSVVTDSAPRAMTENVTGFEQPRHWWIDFNYISMS